MNLIIEESIKSIDCTTIINIQTYFELCMLLIQESNIIIYFFNKNVDKFYL